MKVTARRQPQVWPGALRKKNNLTIERQKVKTDRIISKSGKSVTRNLTLMAAAALILTMPNRVFADQPVFVDLNYQYEDDQTYCVPVLVNDSGRIIEKGLFGSGDLTMIEPITTVYTSLVTGKTVSVRTAGPLTFSYTYTGLVITIRGAGVVTGGTGAWHVAGLFEYVVTFDPITGEESDVTLKETGSQSGDFAEVLCAALQ